MDRPHRDKGPTLACVPYCSVATCILLCLPWSCLFPHRSGGWRLDPLPTGPRPEAVSAILAQQQQQQQELLWGSINVQQLLTDLQVMLTDSLSVSLLNWHACMFRTLQQIQLWLCHLYACQSADYIAGLATFMAQHSLQAKDSMAQL